MTEKETTKIVIKGKVLTIEEAKKEYVILSVVESVPSKRILSLLAKTARPLDRYEISNKIDMSIGYTVQLLTELTKYDLVVDFTIRSRTKYYALTPKGYELVKRLEIS